MIYRHSIVFKKTDIFLRVFLSSQVNNEHIHLAFGMLCCYLKAFSQIVNSS
jgi:hypothetical protein